MDVDPTMPTPMTNVAEYGFEGRFEEWTDDARYFEYSKAAYRIGSGHAPQVPIAQFGPRALPGASRPAWCRWICPKN